MRRMVSAALFFFGMFFMAATTQAVTSCPSSDLTVVNGVCVPTATATGLSDQSVIQVVQNVLNWLLYIMAASATLAFVIAGFQYILSAGDEKQAESAKNTAKYAAIGLAVALSGLVIIRTVGALISGDTSTL